MAKYTIALLDDDAELRAALRLTLANLDIDVFEGNDGATPLSLIRAGMVDAVLTDLHMGEFGGRQLLRALRSDGNDIPVIVYTGDAGRGVADEMQDLGCAHLLHKPLSGKDLVKVAKTAVEFGAALKVFLARLEEKDPALLAEWKNLVRARYGFPPH
jgi:CheY-like chemotaxis protein